MLDIVNAFDIILKEILLIIDTIFFKKYPKFICIIQNKPNLLSNSLLNYFNLKNVFISNFQLLIQISINLNCILLICLVIKYKYIEIILIDYFQIIYLVSFKLLQFNLIASLY